MSRCFAFLISAQAFVTTGRRIVWLMLPALIALGLAPLPGWAETNDLNESGWGFNGAYDVSRVYLDGGGDPSRAWGAPDELDPYGYVPEEPGSIDRDLVAPIDPKLPVLISYDLRYLKNKISTHNYLVIGADVADYVGGNSPDEPNAVWFGFANDRFLVGRGTDFDLPEGTPGDGTPGPDIDLLFSSDSKTGDGNYVDDSRVRLRMIYDPNKSAVTHFQADYDLDGNYDEELFDRDTNPIDDLAIPGLNVGNWVLMSNIAKGNSRTDSIVIAQRSLRLDFTDDGDVDGMDVDVICEAIRLGSSANSSLDLDGNSLVNKADLEWFLSNDRSFYGDAQYDHRVNFSDFVALANNFGKPGNWTQGDFNCDGRVEFPDFVVLAQHFGSAAGLPVRDSSSVASAIPEPAGLVLLALGVVGWLLPCRRR